MRRQLGFAATVAIGLTIGCNNDSEADSQEEACQNAIDVVSSCYDEGCRTSSSTFCNCWRQNMDMDATCTCIPQDIHLICEIYNVDIFDASTYDCAAAMTAVESFCP